MKIHGVTIRNLHNTVDSEYNFGSFAYLHGKNGSGKSTVLQAIQLALLGYIPGTGKTKSDIAEHSCGDDMTTSLDFGDSFLNYEMHKHGRSIDISTNLSQDDVDAILGNLKLPVFNFSEFSTMSANKLKDWFIDFLPESTIQIDWKIELCKALTSAGLHIESGEFDDFIAELSDYAHSCAESPLDQIRGLNAYLKEHQSIVKSEITRIQKTIESLVYYEDVETSGMQNPDIIKAEIEKYQADLASLKASVLASEYAKARIQKYEALISSRGLNIDSLSEDLESNLEYTELLEKVKCYESDIQYYTERIAGYNTRITEIKYSMSQYNSILSAPDKCPYCDIPCASLDSTRERAQEQLVSAQEELDEVNSQLVEAKTLLDQIKHHQSEAAKRMDAYRTAVTDWIPAIRTEQKSIIQDSQNTESHMSECKERIDSLTDTLVKIKANEQYATLSETIMKDKMIAEKKLEIIKILTKLTDVNGMQSSVMTSPFEDFSMAISEVYSEMVEDGARIAFNIEEKANSFGFGIIRNGEYIGFDYLSSGEKCIVTLSLLIGIVHGSNAKLRILLIDDMLDHLDSERATKCFNALYHVCNDYSIQIIAAGVIPCEHPLADEFVHHIGG